jgi:single-strand DNA-binding protein
MRAPHVNHICIAGCLTQDPVLRKVPSGASAGDFRLAADDSYTDKEGKTVGQTCFLTVKTWGKTADLVHQYVSKGDPVLVEGVLAYETWESKTGEKRSRLFVRSHRVHFLKPRPAGSEPIPAAAWAPTSASTTASKTCATSSSA